MAGLGGVRSVLCTSRKGQTKREREREREKGDEMNDESARGSEQRIDKRMGAECRYQFYERISGHKSLYFRFRVWKCRPEAVWPLRKS